MLTGQMYGEGDSHANNVELSAQNPDLTVNSANQTVSTDTPAATSAESIATEPPFVLIDPLPDRDSNVIKEDRPAVPLTYQLPFFFTWQVRNKEQVCKLLGAIDTIFEEFNSSRRARAALDVEVDINQILAYRMLQISFEDIVHQAAAQRIEDYKKPSTKEYMTFEVEELATSDAEPDTNPILANDPANVTEVAELQEWVSGLQQMCRLQMDMNGNLEKVNTNQEKINDIQHEVNDEQARAIKNLERQIEILEKVNKAQEAQRVRFEYDRKLPGAQHYIDLTLYLTDGQESEVELVREVIAEASEEKLEAMLKLIVNNESDDAFFRYEEYQKLQGVLAKISQQLTDVGYNSYLRAHYDDRPQDYVRAEDHDLKVFHKNKAKFIDKFCVYSSSEEEAEEETVATTDQQPAPDTITEPQLEATKAEAATE